MSAAFDRVREALEEHGCNPRKSGAQYVARCPAHDDRVASLSFGLGTKKPDTVVLKCHAGCTYQQVMAALGLENGERRMDSQSSSNVERLEHVYQDAEGVPLARKVRVIRGGMTARSSSGGKALWWEYPHNGQWYAPAKLPPGVPHEAPRVLYRLPDVLTAIRTCQAVCVAEGEKCVDALTSLGLTATTNPSGASTGDPKWLPEHAEQLRGATAVRIFADDDQPGIAHAEAVARTTLAVGVPDVRVVRLEGQHKPDGTTGGGDVADWVRERRDRPADDVRAELERFAEAAPPWTPRETTSGSMTRAPDNPWATALDVHDFVSVIEPERDFLVPRLIVRGAVTAWFSPRGIGKTLVAHHVAIDLAVHGHRVLVIDRDNPRCEVRRRLSAWGPAAVGRGNLRVITRDKAPPLTDSASWARFPVGEYDLIILDSFDSAAEGVGEQDSSKTSVAVASLLDVVRGTSGPAALLLGNTTKSGSYGRGSGVLEDRLDIVFEVRDATGLKPSGMKDWWLELPPSGRDAWADRASRRNKRESYRLAFIPSKFRVGEEPDPFAFEISCAQEPWSCTDITDALVSDGAQTRARAEAAEADKYERAWAALKAEVAALHGRGSMIEKRAAEQFLMDRGITRKDARSLITNQNGVSWRVRGDGKRGAPEILLPLEGVGSVGSPARIEHREDPHKSRSDAHPILAAPDPSGRPESEPAEPAPIAPAIDRGFWPPTSANTATPVPLGRVVKWCDGELTAGLLFPEERGGVVENG